MPRDSTLRASSTRVVPTRVHVDSSAPYGIATWQNKHNLVPGKQAVYEGRMGKAQQRWEAWEILALVFGRLDARSIAIASCVSKTWCQVGGQEELWRDLCLAKWPSLASHSGAFVVKELAGSYRKLYALRYQARQCRPTNAKPWLSMQNLVFMVDVSYEDRVVCSFIRTGFELGPFSAPGDGEGGIFRFAVDTSGNNFTEGGRRWGTEGVRVSKDFKVSWAMMLKGCQKIFQVLDSKRPGQIMGNTCNFSECLPSHSCCSPGVMRHVAEVNLGFASVDASTGSSDNGGNLRICEVCLSMLNTVTWRYFSLNDALRYLQHAFLI